ncbi:ABC transporter substrate-binding protein [Pokkaliibacter plantistimulans]|uniref:ABC transporter substrate-binding protein n=1 Tax=Proteobacteria bacterium 228 TaxID=2083153 RepID=A0A2S5KV15_9PROT|nr:substrate-binding domain-containing protein [Pokkaliibacter plantistimulans]PPC78697.1 ABC transporter substrate-binding protein [Pokkaliibacter plantistimulans]
MSTFKLRWLFTCTLLMFLPLSMAQADDAEFMTAEELFQHNPEQKALSQTLVDRVKNAATSNHAAWQDHTPLKLAIIYPGAQVSDYWRRNIQAFQARLDELGIRYDLTVSSTSPGKDESKAAEDFSAVLAQKPDYIITTLDSPAQKRMIEYVLATGLSKIILQNITTPVRTWESRPPLLYVGFDHVTGTRLLADYFKQKFNGNASYGLLYWTPGVVSKDRGDSFISMMEATGRMKLLQSYYTDANRESARKATESLLQSSDTISFIYACTTDLALGAADAVTASHRKADILINGWGGGASELEAIQKGQLDVTVMRMNDDTGVAMAEAIAMDLANQPVPRIYSGEFRLVTRDTPADELKAYENYAFRYSGAP